MSTALHRPALSLLGSLVLLTSCGGDGEPKSAPTPCASPVAVDRRDLRLLPEDLPLAEYGVVTEVKLKRGYVGADAVTEARIVELYPPLARKVLDEGYQIVSSENEGFEAEIFFVGGKRITGAYRMTKGPCEGQVTLKLLYGRTRYPGG